MPISAQRPSQAGSVPSDPDLFAGKTNLLPNQLLMWLGQQQDSESPLYNMAMTFEIKGNIDPEAFTKAWYSLVEACDVLRTVVEIVAGVPQQRVIAAATNALERIDLSQARDAEAELRRIVQERTNRPLELSAQLYDSVLFRLSKSRWIWYLNQHHIISDVLSFSILYRLLSQRYELALAGELEQAPALLQFSAYRAERASVRAATVAARAREHWQTLVNDPPEAPVLFGRPCTAGQGTRMPRRSLTLDSSRSKRMLELATMSSFASLSQEFSLFTMFSAVLGATVERLSGAERLILCTPLHNRQRPAHMDTPGPFISLYPLALEINESSTFETLAKQTNEATIEAMRHMPHAPSDVGALRHWHIVINPLTAKFGKFAGHRVHAQWHHSEHGDRHHALRLQIHDLNDSGCLTLEFDFHEHIFDKSTQEDFQRHFVSMLDALLEAPSKAVAAVDLLSRDERRAFLKRFNQTELTHKSFALVPQLIDEQCERTPSAIALQSGSRTLSYATLQRRANRLAHWLIERGVGADKPVALCMGRCPEAAIAMLAIWKAGAAYLPLDPAYPSARLRLILEDAAVALLLVDASWQADLVPSLEAIEVESTGNQFLTYPETPPDVAAAPERLAYIMYTSGSTGQPKGTMVHHRGLANYICWARDFYLRGIRPDFALFSSLAFDLTVTSLFTPLVCGGRLIIYPEQGEADLTLAQVIGENRVEILKLTPAHLRLMESLNLSDSRLRKLIVGGEDLKRGLAARISERFEHNIELYNEYGPTETVVGCLIHRFDPQTDLAASVPIGKPIANARVYVLDQRQQPVPTGVVGEIVIGGAGVARGYLNYPELTREKFIPDPFKLDEMVYRSGDLARWNRQGMLEFLGRKDHQVKVRGVRVELGEVENVMLQHRFVESAVAHLQANDAAFDMPHADRHCAQCGLPSNYPDAIFDEVGVCSTCREFEQLRDRVASYFRTENELREIIAKRRERARGAQDCIVLLSGGKDSTYMLYQMVREIGANPLVFSLDNGYISDQAKANIERVTQDLNVELYWGSTPHMDVIFADSLRRHSNVCNGCFKTIYTLSLRLAHERGIPTIVTGLARGQLFETRLSDTFEAREFDPATIDHTVLEARKAYHRIQDAPTRCLDTRGIVDGTLLEEIEFVDFYRYTDVSLDKVYRYLDENVPWIRPKDTGRSTNCRINDTGIYVHTRERGFHNYALPYSWDVRLGHKQREAAMAELDDKIDEVEVQAILTRLGYRMPENKTTTLAGYYVSSGSLGANELQTFVAERLPAAIVPEVFVELSALPLTTNGKVDRDALPLVNRGRGSSWRTESDKYVAPRNSTETLLANIWADVFRIDKVGATDNFFALGGDSLIGIQILARAAEAGLQLSTDALFRQPTIELLAAHATQSPQPQSRFEGDASSRIPLLPMQHWLLEGEREIPTPWNLGIVLEMNRPISDATLVGAIRAVYASHTALRCAWHRHEDDWIQDADIDSSPPELGQINLRSVPVAERDAHLDAAISQVERSLDPATGHLLAVARINNANPNRDQLYLTAHHLAVDGVSWQILLKDLDEACSRIDSGLSAELEAPKTPIGRWAEFLAESVRSDEILAQRSSWGAILNECLESPLPNDPGANSSNGDRGPRQLRRALSRDLTRELFSSMGGSRGVPMDAILLTALHEVLCGWTRQETIGIALEAHGRDWVNTTADLSRTVGWLTALFPVALSAPINADATQRYVAIRNSLQVAPSPRAGFGMLRYLHALDQSDHASEPQVLFNYLGRLDRLLPSSSLFNAEHNWRAARSASCNNRFAFEINLVVVNEELQVDWQFHPDRHTESTVSTLAERFVATLGALAVPGAIDFERAMVPADFPLAELKPNEIEVLLSQTSELEDVYPLSALQEGILFHSLYAPDSGVYMLQFDADLPDDVDLTAYEAAWQALLRRHSALRTAFVWRGLERPLQWVCRNVSMAIEHEDWRQLSELEQKAKLAARRTSKVRLDLHRAPLMRLVIVRKSERQYRLLWDFHHLIIDGQSLTRIVDEIGRLYEAICEHKPQPPLPRFSFADFIADIAERDVKDTDLYWGAALAGFKTSTAIPGDRNPTGPPEQEPSSGLVPLVIDSGTSSRLMKWAASEQLAMASLLQGAWALALSVWNNTDDIVFGAIVSGRPVRLGGAPGTLGLFANTLPLRVRTIPAETLPSFLSTIQNTLVAARDFDFVSPARLHRFTALAPTATLFHSAIGVHHLSEASPSVRQVAERAGLCEVNVVDWSTLPISIIVEVGECINIDVKYATARFTDTGARSIANGLAAVLKLLAESPALTVADVQIRLAKSLRSQSDLKLSAASRLRELRRRPNTQGDDT